MRQLNLKYLAAGILTKVILTGLVVVYNKRLANEVGGMREKKWKFRDFLSRQSSLAMKFKGEGT